MALGEVGLKDWLSIAFRELGMGVALGVILGIVGSCRIGLWQALFGTYHQFAAVMADTIFFSLIGVVAFGTICGAMLPFILRKLRLDPASASAPLVATVVDVGGLIIYFSVARWTLHGTLLS